jgi:membrane-bound serine protease (ClpP class)
MELLFDPNVAYVLLVGGLLLAVLALLSPGTGLLEIGAMFMLVLAGFIIVNFSINWWALGVLVLGTFPFLLALRKSRRILFLVIALAALLVGSIFLIADRVTGAPVVNPWLAGVLSLLVTVFVWVASRRMLEALGLPKQSVNQVIGTTGEARTDILSEGTVYVGGEEWTARSESFIQAGRTVRVTAREGLVLVVEPVENV